MIPSLLPRSSLAIVLGLLTANSTTAFPLRDQPDLFFKPGPEAPHELPAGQPYPKGRTLFFSLSGNLEGEELAKAKRLGVALLATHPDKSGKNEIPVGYPIGLPRNENELAFTASEELSREIASQVKAVAEERPIAFWHLGPGDFQPRDSKEKTYLQTATKAITESDPLKRPIWAFNPPEANTGYLSHISPWVDLLGKSLKVPTEHPSRIFVRWSMERAVEAIHETTSDAIPVAVPALPTGATATSLPAAVRHDLYLSLILGAKGVVTAPPTSQEGEPDTATWQAFQSACLQTAEELLGDLRLGECLLFGEPREDLEVDIVDGPAQLETSLPGGKQTTHYPSVTHLELAYGKNRYLVLVNSAPEPLTVMVGGMPYDAVDAESLLETSGPMPIAEGEFEVELKPLDVKIYRLTRR